ncbi:MAG: response regulator [Aestuariibacter sp.]|uniref:response regulator n=1 Tax=Marisediminitalea aggregata TaxID=634436 RepID=UPI0020CC93F9|nr:response regulator [Marisediminitalea aggregata]MCP4236624.1 response regulator [Aestuariibacter sp.]MCP9477508.1 response regulator [Marisediminitalea aggregata]
MSTFTVAVIDDDEVSLELIAHIIESELDAQVISFTRSAFAREFLMHQTDTSLDMIVSDMVMPEYDGLSLLRACREKGLSVPFIFMTAYATRQTEMLAKQLGAVAYLVKPIRREKLISLLTEQLTK